MTWDITRPVTEGPQLQNYLNTMDAAAPTTLFELQNDINLSTQLNIPAGVTVGFTSALDNQFYLSGREQHRIMNITTSPANTTAVYVGNIILKDGMTTDDGGAIYSQPIGAANLNIGTGAVIDGNHATNGGAIAISRGCVSMSGGTIISNHATGYGGGIYIGVPDMVPCNAVFYMTAGQIDNNTALLGGGGLYAGTFGGMVRIYGGRFYKNYTAASGGGMYVANLTMIDGLVQGNIADVAGGGVFLMGTGTIDPSGAGGLIEFRENKAVVRGGGIAMNDNHSDVSLAIGDGVNMLGNTAGGTGATGGGGAIWVAHSKLANLTVAPLAIFSGNRAPTGYALRLPEDDAVYLANIHATTWSSPFTQGYNNFDISYIGRNPEPGCTTTGERMVDMCLPVEVKPFANIGTITTRCCGPARITPGTNICEGIPDGNCNFTISQTLCVEVPVEFGAEVTPGEVHVGCTGNDCANCPQQGEA